jgi:hypothetical protein
MLYLLLEGGFMLYLVLAASSQLLIVHLGVWNRGTNYESEDIGDQLLRNRLSSSEKLYVGTSPLPECSIPGFPVNREIVRAGPSISRYLGPRPLSERQVMVAVIRHLTAGCRLRRSPAPFP